MTITYDNAAELLATARSADAGKPLARNTRLFKRDDDYAIRFHETDIVTIHADGTFTLDSGGWRTLTTKARMNEFAPVNLYQEKGIWYLGRYDGPTYMYDDAMVVDAMGTPLDPVSADTMKATEKAGRKLSRMTTKYVNGFMADIMANGLREPSNGDCWGCLFGLGGSGTATGSLSADGTLTDTTGKADPLGVDHLLDHMTERYYVASLLLLAVRERAGANAEFHCGMIAGDVKAGREPWLAREALKRYFAKRRDKLRDALLATTVTV